MKTFDVAKAISGEPISTACGTTVEIWTWSFNAEHNPDMTIIGRVKKVLEDGTQTDYDLMAFWDRKGRSMLSSKYDLICGAAK